MRIYSETLTAADITNAAQPISGVYVDSLDMIRKPRIRSRGWTVRLASISSNRWRNTGQYGAETWGPNAASWDDHGRFFAALFDLDPSARIATYDGRDDFHRSTAGKYATAAVETAGVC